MIKAKFDPTLYRVEITAMALFGTQIRRVKSALAAPPNIDAEFKPIAKQILDESTSTGEKGFTGKRSFAGFC